MARYTGPVCRLCRRERMKLFLKGTKCDTMRCPIERARTRRASTAAVASATASTCSSCVRSRRPPHLRPAREAVPQPLRQGEQQPGITGENLLRLLELRIDNVVFRAGFASSRNQARQFVRHGHVLVNGKRVTIPSYTRAQGRRRRAARQGAAR